MKQDVDLSFLPTEEQAIFAAKFVPAPKDSAPRKNGPLYPVADTQAQEAKPKGRVNLISAASIVMRPIEWRWHGFLAAGKLHILGGAPGTGKTTLAILLASIVSNGGLWPDGTNAEQGNVLIWSGEDDPADTLIPRLAAVGADMSRIKFIGPVTEGEESRPFDPAKDMQGLEEAIAAIGGAAALIVDPIVSAVAGDSHKNSETRRALQPIVDLGEKTGVAIIGITHFSKGTAGRDPLERITGSLAFVALARVVFVAAKEAEPEDHHNAKRFFTRAKSNIGPDGGGFEYSIQQGPLEEDERIIASRVVFGEALEGTAREILATADAVEESDRAPAKGAAKAFLQALLQSDEWTAQKDVEVAAKSAGISERTLNRAKSDLKVISRKHKTRGWYWRLPEGDMDPPLPDYEPSHDDQDDGWRSTYEPDNTPERPHTVTF